MTKPVERARALNDDDRKVLAELGLPDMTPASSKCADAVMRELRQARLSHVTRALWLHDRTMSEPTTISATAGIKAAQIDASTALLTKTLRELTAVDELLVIPYLGGHLITTESLDE